TPASTRPICPQPIALTAPSPAAVPATSVATGTISATKPAITMSPKPQRKRLADVWTHRSPERDITISSRRGLDRSPSPLPGTSTAPGRTLMSRRRLASRLEVLAEHLELARELGGQGVTEGLEPLA